MYNYNDYAFSAVLSSSWYFLPNANDTILINVNRIISIVHLSTNIIGCFIFSVRTNTTTAIIASTRDTTFQTLLRFCVLSSSVASSSSFSFLDNRRINPNNTDPIAAIKLINAQCAFLAAVGVSASSMIPVSALLDGFGVLVGSIVGVALASGVSLGAIVGSGVTLGLFPPPGTTGTTTAFSQIPFSSFQIVSTGQPLGSSVGSGFGLFFSVTVSLPSSYLMT